MSWKPSMSSSNYELQILTQKIQGTNHSPISVILQVDAWRRCWPRLVISQELWIKLHLWEWKKGDRCMLYDKRRISLRSSQVTHQLAVINKVGKITLQNVAFEGITFELAKVRVNELSFVIPFPCPREKFTHYAANEAYPWNRFRGTGKVNSWTILHLGVKIHKFQYHEQS